MLYISISLKTRKFLGFMYKDFEAAKRRRSHSDCPRFIAEFDIQIDSFILALGPDHPLGPAVGPFFSLRISFSNFPLCCERSSPKRPKGLGVTRFRTPRAPTIPALPKHPTLVGRS